MTKDEAPVDLMSALKASIEKAKATRSARIAGGGAGTEKTVPAYNPWAWPDFHPEVRVTRCGQQSSHGPHFMDHGPDQPRNCPGTGEWVECPRCTQLVPAISAVAARHQVDGQWCELQDYERTLKRRAGAR